MSFEDSIKALTASNEALAKANMKIAEANETLAAAQTEYADMLRTSIGLASGTAIEGVGKGAGDGGTKPLTAAQKKAAEKKAAEEAAAKKPEVDDFGDPIVDEFGDTDADAVPDKLDGDMVKAKLLEVRDAYGDKAPALNVIKEFGYNAIPDVKPADYEKVYKAACKAIKAAPKK